MKFDWRHIWFSVHLYKQYTYSIFDVTKSLASIDYCIFYILYNYNNILIIHNNNTRKKQYNTET